MFNAKVIDIARLFSLKQKTSYIRVFGTADEWVFDSIEIPNEIRKVPVLSIRAENDNVIMYISYNDIADYTAFKFNYMAGHLVKISDQPC